jgi:hypothetical protein
MAGADQQFDAPLADVLIQFDSHSRHVAERNRQYPLTRHFGTVSDRRQDIQVAELRVFGLQFSLGYPARQKIEDKRHPDAGALNAALSSADRGIDGNAIEEFVQSR